MHGTSAAENADASTRSRDVTFAGSGDVSTWPSAASENQARRNPTPRRPPSIVAGARAKPVVNSAYTSGTSTASRSGGGAGSSGPSGAFLGAGAAAGGGSGTAAPGSSGGGAGGPAAATGSSTSATAEASVSPSASQRGSSRVRLPDGFPGWAEVISARTVGPRATTRTWRSSVASSRNGSYPSRLTTRARNAASFAHLPPGSSTS